MSFPPEYIQPLESLQRRAPIEGRDHIVATVEYAFGPVGITPEMADRLIPRASAPATVVDAVDEERADCEKPIRDENGKFLGCEPGGGSEAAAGKESGGGSNAKRETIESHPDDSPRVARAKARRAQSRKENPDFDPARAEEYDHTVVKEAKQLDDAERRGLIKKFGGTEKIDEIKQARVKAVAAEADEIHDAHAAAAAKLSELNRVNSFGGDSLIEKAHVDGEDLEFHDTANSLGTDTKGGLDVEGVPVDYPDDEYEPEEPIEPDSIDFRTENEEGEGEIDEEAFEAAKQKYKEDVKAHKKALVEHKARREAKKAEVLKKVEEAAAALEEVHERQLLAMEKLKAARAEAKAKVKEAFKQADADPEDLISEDVKARAKKADKYFEDGGEDSDLDEDEEVVRQRYQQASDDYDAAYSAAELLRDEAEAAKDDALDDDDVADKIEQLKNTARATKNQAATLRRVLKQKPKVYAKPALTKSPDDEEDDDDAEDEDEE